MPPLNLNNIYLWKKNSVYNFPWQRQHLNVDFLKYEQKRIKETSEWYFNEWQRAKIGESLKEVYYYAIPIDVDSSLKVAISSKGNYNFCGLSALKNCLQIQLLMLLPQTKNIPKPNSLIRINKSKKDFIHNEKNNRVEYVIIVEDFEEVDSSYIYVDIPHEKKDIYKFMKENMINDDLIISSFQPTISGSPYTNRKGGISFSAFLESNPFSEELIKTLKLMQPLEFTDLQFKIPPKLIIGKKFISPEGIIFNLSEKNVIGKNFFSAFSSYNYDKLNSELTKRDYFNGEYSIACSLTPRGDNASELLRDIISKFLKTEITHPFTKDELNSCDIDLSKTQKNISEDLWLQVINQKQITPLLNQNSPEIIKLRESLIPHWKIILESLGLKKKTEQEARVYSYASFDNILRVAKSIARDEYKENVDDTNLKKSFNLFVENADSLVNNPKIQKYAKIVIPDFIESEKFNTIRAELSIHSLNITELFESVNEFFKDIYELQEYIDRKLIPSGNVYEPKQGYYKWV